MQRRLRKALVRGERATHWLYDQGCLILKGASGHEETEVPVQHLADEAALHEHVQRLRAKRWVSEAAIRELLAISEQEIAK